jgi:hypothetical protein
MKKMEALAHEEKHFAASRRTRVAELERRIARLIDAVESTGMSAALRQRLIETEHELEALKSDPASVPTADHVHVTCSPATSAP